MDPTFEQQFANALVNQTQVDVPMNKDDNELPFGLYNPETEGKVSWLCDYDQDHKITSVFAFDNGDQSDRKVAYLGSIDEAKQTRDILLQNGWQKLKAPKVTFSYPGQKEGKPMNRQQRKWLQKKLKQAQKSNPFKDDDDSRGNN